MTTLEAHGFVGEIDEQLHLDNREHFTRDVRQFKGKRVTLTIEEEQDVRSLAANARFWKICELAAEVMSTGLAIPIHKEEAKLALCRAFLGLVDTPFGPVPRGTRNLSRSAMSELQAKIEGHYASMGTPLPLDGIA